MRSDHTSVVVEAQALDRRGYASPLYARRGALVLAVALALVACQQTPQVSPAPAALVSVTAPVNPVASATTAPTATAAPSDTETQRPVSAPTLPATVTPLAPPSGDLSRWRLRPWNAEAADERNGQMAAWLEHFGERPEDGPFHLSTWLVFHSFLADAEAEALLRFPDAPQAERWQWDHAYNLAAAGGPGIVGGEWEVAAYVDLIKTALDGDQATLATLPQWFALHEQRMTLTTQLLQAPEGFDASALVTLDEMAYLWVGDRAGTYSVAVLDSDVLNAEPVASDATLIDATGDGFDEIVLTMGQVTCCDVYRMTTIYDVSSGSPTSLNLAGAPLTTGGQSTVEPWTSPDGHAGLAYRTLYATPSPTLCSVSQTDHYAWTGEIFEWIDTAYSALDPGADGAAEVCVDARSLVSDPAEWAAAVAALRDTTAYDVALDEWTLRLRYRVGEAAAREGQADRARSLFQAALDVDVANETAAAPWREAAQHFLEADPAASFYTTCAGVALCDGQAALQAAAAGLGADDLASLADRLRALGVDVRAVGDLPPVSSAALRWLVAVNPNTQARELWLAAADGDHLQASYVFGLSSDTPAISQAASTDGAVSFVVDTSKGPVEIDVKWLALSGRLQIGRRPAGPRVTQAVVNSLSVEMEQLRRDLLAGAPPGPIAARVTALEDQVACPDGEWCRTWLYVRGLSAELLGDDATAALAYARLWQVADDWPIGLWARLRLESVP